jgi:hypothetical protein
VFVGTDEGAFELCEAGWERSGRRAQEGREDGGYVTHGFGGGGKSVDVSAEK